MPALVHAMLFLCCRVLFLCLRIVFLCLRIVFLRGLFLYSLILILYNHIKNTHLYLAFESESEMGDIMRNGVMRPFKPLWRRLFVLFLFPVPKADYLGCDDDIQNEYMLLSTINILRP